MIFLRFAIQDLVHDWGRSLLTVGTLAAIVVAYLILAALNQAFQGYGKVAQQQFTNLTVISSDALDPIDSSLGDNVLQAVKALGNPAVERVAPFYFRHMRIEDHVMQVRAVALEDMATINRLSLVQGKWPQADDDLIASEGAVQLTHWNLGSVVQIYGSDFHLVGIVSASGSRYSSLWMTLQAGEKLFGTRRGYQVILLQLKPGSDVEAVRSAVETRLKQSGRYSVYLESQITDRYYQSTGGIRRLNLVEVFIALLAMTFGSYNATSLTLVERTREVGMLRVLGFFPARLRSFLFIRTLLQTLLAYIIGLGFALFFVENRQALSPIVIYAEAMPLSLPGWSIASGLALSICFSALGVWLPTRNYFRTSVIEQTRG